MFLCDGRNDNRSLDADGSYNQDRDWFYQNVRMQQALEGMFADNVNVPRWAVLPHRSRCVLQKRDTT